MIGTHEAGLRPCSQPISVPAGSRLRTPTLGQLQLLWGSCGDNVAHGTTTKRGGSLGLSAKGLGLAGHQGSAGRAIWLSTVGGGRRRGSAGGRGHLVVVGALEQGRVIAVHLQGGVTGDVGGAAAPDPGVRM